MASCQPCAKRIYPTCEHNYTAKYTGWAQKIGKFFVRLIIFIQYWSIFKLTITKDPNILQMCHYTTLWIVNVLKQQLKIRLL